MQKKSNAGDAYAKLSRLEHEPKTPETVQMIRQAISGKSRLLVIRAIEIAAALNVVEVVPEMVEAFGRFCIDGPKLAPRGCIQF